MAKPQLSQLTSDEQRLLEEIWERIRPSHWFTFTASSPREVGALVDRAGGVLNRLAKQFPGLRSVVIGSDNRGKSSPHLHGFLFVPIELEPFLLKMSEAWSWGDVIEVEALDPAGGAMAYVIRQMIEGEILWSDGEPPQSPADSPTNSNPAGTSRRPSKERRLFLKDLARIEAHDRLKRELRRDRERQRQRIAEVERQLAPQRTGGRIIRRRLHWMQQKALEPSPIEVTVHLEGMRALELPMTLSREAAARGWPTGTMDVKELLDGIEAGLWELPTVCFDGERIGLSQAQVDRWLRIRRPSHRRLDHSAPRHASPVFTVDFRRALALELNPAAVKVVRPTQVDGAGWLRIDAYTGSVRLLSRRITDLAAAYEVARIGVSVHLARTGLGCAVGCRRKQLGDCVVAYGAV